MRSQTSTEEERKRALELYLEGDKSYLKLQSLLVMSLGEILVLILCTLGSENMIGKM